MNDAVPVVVVDPPRAQRRRPLTFSLWSLCVAVAIACIAAAWYGMRQRERSAIEQARRLEAQVEAQQAEINRLRGELGYLSISDPTKVHVLKLEAEGDYRWKWRVYLPPGRKWSLCSSLGQIPPHGFENVRHGWSSIRDGEFTIEVYFDRDEDGNRRFTVSRGGGKSSQTLPEEQFQQLKSAGFSTSMAGSFKTELHDPGAPVELIRLRQHRERPAPPGSRSFGSSDEPEFGFVIWLE